VESRRRGGWGKGRRERGMVWRFFLEAILFVRVAVWMELVRKEDQKLEMGLVERRNPWFSQHFLNYSQQLLSLDSCSIMRRGMRC